MKYLKHYASIITMLVLLLQFTFSSCDGGENDELILVSVSVKHKEGGIATISDTQVITGEEVTLTAIPNEGYSFSHWLVNYKVVSKDNPYTTKINTVTQFEPVFDRDNCNIKVTAGEGGSIKTNKEKEVLYGTVVTLTAIPNKGYSFVNWTVDGVEVSTEATYIVTVTKDVEYVANFISHKVTLIVGEGGTAKSNKTQVRHNELVTFTATPQEGYSFVNWTVNGKEVSKENPYETKIIGDTEFKANFITYYSSSGMENGHAYVDLGLSVKWAVCNIGATTLVGYGDYFAWGETEPKSSYGEDNYTYSSNPTTLPLSADAARVNWGGSWRMPTKAEQDELRDTNNCTWNWTTQNGVKGYKVTSKKNGNSIFLPAAGSRYYSNLSGAGSIGYYWSSSHSTSFGYYACSLTLQSSRVNWSSLSSRYDGRSVRAVCP